MSTEYLSLEEYQGLKKKQNKHGNKRVFIDGRWFHSKAEGKRYEELKLLLQFKAIYDLVCQPRYPILINNIKVFTYVGDFQYKLENGAKVCEDVKGYFTDISKLKIKAFKAYYPEILFKLVKV